MRPPVLPAPCLALLIAIVSMPGILSAQAGKPRAATAEFVDLFDGKTLDGFVQRGGKADYRVEDGCIVGTTVTRTPNSFLCTERHYADFVLEYEFLVDGSLNSGVQIRSNSLPAYRKGRVHGYQVEIDPDLERNRMWTAGIYDESRRGWLDDLRDNEPARRAFKPGQWNHIRVQAVGDSIRTWINGVPAADLVDSMTSSGFIGLQVHGIGKRADKLQVKWRKLRIQDLGRHRWQRLFDGATMRGWSQRGGGRWTVEDGVLVARNSKSETQHGHLFLDRQLADFTVRLRFLAVRGNSGLYFRSAARPGAVGIAGIQAEIDASANVGGLYETGGRRWLVRPDAKVLARSFKPGEWNQLTVSAHGRRVVVRVNGHKTAELRRDQGPLVGQIALQVHGSQDVELRFKDIEALVKVPEPARRNR